MQAQLEKYLKGIGLGEEYFTPFEKVSVKQAKFIEDTLYLSLESDYILDVRVYKEFKKHVDDFKTFKTKYDFTIKNAPRAIEIDMYYQMILDQYYTSVNFFDNFKQLKANFDGNSISFTVNASTLSNGLETIKVGLEEHLSEAGIKYPVKIILKEANEEDVKLIIDEELNKIKEEANTDKIIKVEAPKENKDFYKRGYEKIELCQLTNDDNQVEFTARIFAIDDIVTKKNKLIRNVFVTDDSDSVKLKLMESAKISLDFLKSFKVGDYVNVKGGMIYDSFERDSIFDVKGIEKITIDDSRKDESEEKRVELHLHSKMSAMDGVTDIKKYIEQASKWGHKAIAVTDHGTVQAFPYAQKAGKENNIKIIYGMEGYVVEDKLTPAINPQDIDLQQDSYIAFDLETTGLSTHYDAIIEFGAVKVENGTQVDKLQMFINPLRKLDKFIIDKTNITDEMLIGAPTIAEAMPRILEFIGDNILVAHNATFDYGFLNQNLEELGLPLLTNPVVDTLDLSRCLVPESKHFNLGAIARKFNIGYNEETAHRADYDAMVLSDVYEVLLNKCREKDIRLHSELNSLTPSEAYKSAHPYHMTFLVKNAIGLKNLFKIVTMSHIEYITNIPLIPKSRIAEFREGLLIGSSCFNGEVFEIASTRSYQELKECVRHFDYIEIQPLENYQWLLDTRKILDKERLINILKDIVKAGYELGKIVVATGDCHYLNPRDKIFRDVYINAQSVGMRRHPLYDYTHTVKENPNQHFRTTSEMLEGISFLEDPKIIRDLVITNTNLIADQIEDVEPIKDKLFTPSVPGVDAEKEIRELCNANLHKIYGDNPPQSIVDRMNRELNSICDNGYAVIYYLAYRLVEKSNSDGYLVGSRGSVGSSLVALLCGISEVNPLQPHYICPKCHRIEFFDDGSVKSGFDLEDKACPECGTMMHADGHNIPFETFLGINADKVPDIDLNFAREYQATAHNYTKVLLGADNVFRAGTIGATALKTSMGYVRNYFESIGKTTFRNAELRRIAEGCVEVKRTTGQHPAGIIVVPIGMDVYDFTPVQYPADEVDSSWKTTHFEFSAIHDEILKLDILGHLDPSTLKMLGDLTGVNLKDIPLNDKRVLSLFTGISELNVTEYDIQNHLGSSGVPEFGTSFVKQVLEDSKPTKFSELVQISGLTHGTDVWLNNAQPLVKNKGFSLTDVICCRDDIMLSLVAYGLDRKLAFKIMEKVRKGKGITPEEEAEMKAHNVPDWFIDSCKKIKYMFPKAHAVAYVLMALRVAWFKIYHPLEYYAAVFSKRCNVFDIESMMGGHKDLFNKLVSLKGRIQNHDTTITNKEIELVDVIELALEMTARGFTFSNLSLSKSDSKNFIVDKEHDALIPPFRVLDGLGEAAAESIVNARNEREFISKQDLRDRTQITNTQVQMLEVLHVLDGLDEEDQLTLKLF